MRVLVVGGGGREHALCLALSRSPRLDHLYAAPGNAGIAELATLARLSAGDVEAIVEFVEREQIDLTVVGPEAPLVAGLADELRARGLGVFGPSRDAARIEGSKAWARSLCERHGIPVPRSQAFDDPDAALAFAKSLGFPCVVKADGLAAGKGVTIATDEEQACRALEDSLVRHVFGDAGSTVLVEEFLEGVEVSALALTDGRTVVPLALAQDYKRAFDGDDGPNTGGMGAYSPLPFVDDATELVIRKEILERTVHALQDEGIEYSGVLYAGLMLTADGAKVLEYNCRFGDPETQVIVPRVSSEVSDLLLACVDGTLADHDVDWRPDAAVGVVLASGGYPGAFRNAVPISGLEDAGEVEGVQVFHAGTARREGRVVTAGGRVVTVTALGGDVAEARARAYEACGRIDFEGKQLRRDIAADVGGPREAE